MSAGRPGYRLGVFWSFLSAVLWGSTFVVARYMLEGGRADPLSLSLLRFAIGGSALLLLGAKQHAAELMRVRLSDVPKLMALGLFGMVGMSGLLFLGQRSTSAINASLIMQVCPILILLGGLAIGERIRLRQALGIPLSFLGCLFVVEIIDAGGFRFDSGHLSGDLFVLAGAASWAIYTLAGKSIVARLGGYVASTLAMVCGALEFAAILLCVPGPRVWPSDLASWLAVLYLALLPTAVAYFAWYEAMNRIELALLNVMQYLSPIVTILLAYFLLDENLTWSKSAGIALVLAGVAITSGYGRRRRVASAT